MQQQQASLDNIFPEISFTHDTEGGQPATHPKRLLELVVENVSYASELESDENNLRLLVFNDTGETISFNFLMNEEGSHFTHCRIEYVANNTCWDLPLPVAYDIETGTWVIWEQNIDAEKTDVEDIDIAYTLNSFVSRSVYYVNRVFNDTVDFDTVQNDIVLAISAFIQNKPKEIDNSTAFAKLFLLMAQTATACGVTEEDIGEGIRLVSFLHTETIKTIDDESVSEPNVN